MEPLIIDHLGVAVPNLQTALKFWEETLNIKCTGVEEVADQKVRTAFLPVKDTRIELLEGTSADSPIAKFIEKNGGRGGIQHFAIRVENLEATLAELKAKGVALIDQKPRIGAGGAKIAFVHPKSTSGILLELCEHEEH